MKRHSETTDYVCSSDREDVDSNLLRLRSHIFGEMQKRAIATSFLQDHYHDAMWLNREVTELAPKNVVWITRECGSHMWDQDQHIAAGGDPMPKVLDYWVKASEAFAAYKITVSVVGGAGSVAVRFELLETNQDFS